MKYKNIEWTDEQVKKFWDYESQFPEKYFTHTFGGRILEEIGGHLKGKKNVLDYGTGIGLLIPHLLKHNFEVTGTDFSHDSIETVNKRFKNESNFNGAYYIDDIININKKYDVIFCIEMIEHINDHYLDITFKNLKHLLSDGGVVVITTPNDEKLEDNMIFCVNCDSTFHRWQHLKSWSTSSLEKVITNYGFKKEKIYTTFFNPIVKEEKKSIPGLIAGFIRKYILLRTEIKNNISTVKAPHLVAIIKK
jgi:2-polyprenyl-3-methyl-5-hydroxy-6-metoxy-1,4-benzoquinol methylase